jgi:hypothetical protein
MEDRFMHPLVNRHLRLRREKVFGDRPRAPWDCEAEVRITKLVEVLSHKAKKGKDYGLQTGEFTRMPRVTRLTLVTAFVAAVNVVTIASTAEAQSPSDTATIKELQKRLDQRDALIRNLLRRVEKLEGAERSSAGARGEGQQHKQPAPAPRGGATTQQAEASPSVPTAKARSQTVQRRGQPPPQSAQQAQQASGASSSSTGPGEFTVSADAAQHALERALVESGALLLAPWSAEFVPSVTYQYNQISHPDQIALATGGAVFVTENAARSTQVEAAALLRLGLPWDSQAQVRIPYDYKNLSNVDRVVGTGISDKSIDATGLGSVSLTFTKQLLTEKEWLPNLFASGAWQSAGQTQKGIPLGMGFDDFQVGLVATKRQDPIVFTAGFTYQTSLENKGVLPGDEFTPSVGLVLGVSPETSLQFSQQVSFVNSVRRNNQVIPGSNQVSGIFNVGLLSILGPGLVLNLNAGIGETADAPDLTVQLSIPIRLN